MRAPRASQGCLAELGPRKHATNCPPQPIDAPHARRNGLCCPGEGPSSLLLLLTSLPSSQDTQDSAKEPGTNSGASAFRGLLALERGMAEMGCAVASCRREKDKKALLGLELLCCASGLKH